MDELATTDPTTEAILTVLRDEGVECHSRDTDTLAEMLAHAVNSVETAPPPEDARVAELTAQLEAVETSRADMGREIETANAKVAELTKALGDAPSLEQFNTATERVADLSRQVAELESARHSTNG